MLIRSTSLVIAMFWYIMLMPIGLLFFVGGVRTLFGLSTAEHTRHRTFFHILGMLAITFTGAYFVIAPIVLLLNSLR